MWQGGSNFSGEIDLVFSIILGICLFFFLLITFLLVYFTFRYHRTRNSSPTDIEGNTRLEIIWTIIPAILVIGMFFLGLRGFHDMQSPPSDAMRIKVQASMWNWNFTYPNGASSKELVVPVNSPILLELSSFDVIHSFYVPAFRIKKDVVPGASHTVWFSATKPGEYDVLCAEYCGKSHSYMHAVVKVIAPEDFSAWYGATQSR
jgi:cytochrome c oxidase subunit II